MMNVEALDFSDINLDGLDLAEIETMEVSTSSGLPEGGASGGTWSCGNPRGGSCSCSFNPT